MFVARLCFKCVMCLSVCCVEYYEQHCVTNCVTNFSMHGSFFFVLGGPDDGHDLKNSFNHNRILRFYKASEAKVNTRESLMHGSLPPEGDVFASIGTQGVFYRVFLTS